VKFGGKAGLFNAVVELRRAAYFSTMPALETDMRPLPTILGEFGLLFVQLVTMPAAIRLNRMVVAEAATHPELAETFYKVGPGQTREMLIRFFSRPDIAPLFRAELTPSILTLHLLNCLLGDQCRACCFRRKPNPMWRNCAPKWRSAWTCSCAAPCASRWRTDAGRLAAKVSQGGRPLPASPPRHAPRQAQRASGKG